MAAFTRADAQLVIARRFGFPSWPRLKAHLDLVEPCSRSPHGVAEASLAFYLELLELEGGGTLAGGC